MRIRSHRLPPSRPNVRQRRQTCTSRRVRQEPCVAAGLIPASALAGYRTDAVYLRTSPYVPPLWGAVRNAMHALFDLLAAEPESAVRAVIGHWLFGYVHLHHDGNGRMTRFLMNVLLASAGYP